MDINNKYITFGSPIVEEEEIKEVEDSLRSGWLGTGPKVARFEKLVSRYVEAKYGLALNSCTAGLHLSLLVNNIGRGDEVITSPFTFCATANVIVHSGAKPIFVDIKKETMNIDEDKIKQAVTEKTKAIIPVHIAGRPCEMDKILEIAQKHNLIVIEDAAHALGAEYKGKKIGSISDMTCFSFYVTKNIITGEGGMITTNNKDIADKVKVYSLHGLSKDAWKRYSDDGYRHYDVVCAGYKYNMMDLQAAIGIHQIKRIDKYYQKREKSWQFYNHSFKDLPLTLPSEAGDGIKHAKHLYTVLIDKEHVGISRDEFMQELHKQGIGTGVHFLPVHLYSYYRKRWGHKEGDYPNAEYIGDRIVSLPLSAKLLDSDVERIVNSVRKIILKSR